MMPLKEFASGTLLFRPRQYLERLTIDRVVVPTVLEFVVDAPADPDVEIEGYREITLVEEVVQIRSQKDAIANKMRSLFGIGLNMACFERRQRSLAGHCTAAIVGIGDKNAKGPLAETGPKYLRLAIAIVSSLGWLFEAGRNRRS